MPARWRWRCGTAGLVVAGVGAGDARRGVRLPLSEAGVRAARGSRAGSSPSSSRPRAPRWPTPTATSARRRRSWRRPRTIDSYFSVVNIGDGVSRGIIFTNLEDWSDSAPGRSRRSSARCRDSTSRIPGVFAFANNPPAFGWGSPVNFVIQHPDFDCPGQGQRHPAGPGPADAGAAQRGQRPPGQQAASSPSTSTATARRTWASRWATSPRRSRCCWAATRDQHLHPQQQAVRRDRAARPAGPRHAERHDRPVRAGPGRRAGQARGAGQRAGGRGRRGSSTTSTGCAPPPSPPAWPRASPWARRSTRSTASPTRCCRREAAPRWPASRASWRRAARRSTSPSCSRWSWCSWCWRASSSRWCTPSRCCWRCRSR